MDMPRAIRPLRHIRAHSERPAATARSQLAPPTHAALPSSPFRPSGLLHAQPYLQRTPICPLPVGTNVNPVPEFFDELIGLDSESLPDTYYGIIPWRNLVRHDGFNDYTYENDIGLVFAETCMNSGSRVAPVDIATKSGRLASCVSEHARSARACVTRTYLEVPRARECSTGAGQQACCVAPQGQRCVGDGAAAVRALAVA